MKIPVNLSIEKQIWKDYQKLCIDNDLIASIEIEQFMKKQIKRG